MLKMKTNTLLKSSLTWLVQKIGEHFVQISLGSISLIAILAFFKKIPPVLQFNLAVPTWIFLCLIILFFTLGFMLGKPKQQSFFFIHKDVKWQANTTPIGLGYLFSGAFCIKCGTKYVQQFSGYPHHVNLFCPECNATIPNYPYEQIQQEAKNLAEAKVKKHKNIPT